MGHRRGRSGSTSHTLPLAFIRLPLDSRFRCTVRSCLHLNEAAQPRGWNDVLPLRGCFELEFGHWPGTHLEQNASDGSSWLYTSQQIGQGALLGLPRSVCCMCRWSRDIRCLRDLLYASEGRPTAMTGSAVGQDGPGLLCRIMAMDTWRSSGLIHAQT